MLKFVCPRCKATRLEEVMTNVTQFSVIQTVEEKDGEAMVEYAAEGNTEEGEIDRYQCVSCGYVLEGVTEPEELVEWLRSHAPAS